MDKDTIRNLLYAMIAFLVIMSLGRYLLPPVTPPPNQGTTDTQQTSNAQPQQPGQTQPVASPGQGQAVASPGQPQPATAPQVQQNLFEVIEAPQEQEIVIGAQNPTDEEVGDEIKEDPYRMRIALSNVGASVDTALMADHLQVKNGTDRYKLLKPIVRTDPVTMRTTATYRSLGIENINIDGTDIALADKKWHASKTNTDSGEKAEFTIDIHKSGNPALRLTRSLELPRQDRKSGRHDVNSKLTIENLSDAPMTAIVTFMGGLGIELEGSRMDDRVIDFGLLYGGVVEGSRSAYAKVGNSESRTLPLYNAATDPTVKFSWASTANKYFTCTIAPLAPDLSDNAAYIAAVDAVDLDRIAETDDDITVRFVTKPIITRPQEPITFPASLYIGGKDADAFKTVDEYKNRNYYYQIAKNFPWCTFGPLVEVMIWLLNNLYFIFGNFGIAIIILVLVVRVLLHPLTKHGQISMTKMQKAAGAMQGKVEELKKKYPNDKAKLQQEQMKLFRESGVGPTSGMMGCLPMLLQMPIWVALWMALSYNILMRHEPFMLWITDLSSQDALYTFATAIKIPVLGWTIESFNLLPLLLAVFMYTQQKLMQPPPNPDMTDQQKQQQETMQKMMPLMNIMMLVLFYKAPSGLTFYIMCSSAIGTFEQMRIRKHIKEMDAAGLLMAPKKKPEGESKMNIKAPGWLDKLQSMADDAKSSQPPTGKNKGKKKN